MLESDDASPDCSIGPPGFATGDPVETPLDQLLSPSIQRTTVDATPAFELKLRISHCRAEAVEDWARQEMEWDAFCHPRRGGFYRTTTLYLDTPELDVFHRSPGYRRRKYRLRRYGEESAIYLERKSRRGDRVRKRRTAVSLGDLSRFANEETPEWAGQWFKERVNLHSLQPASRITYCRAAFVKLTSQGAVRLTLDRKIQGVVASGWNLTPVNDGHEILCEEVVCELKFRHGLPTMFKDLINALQLQTGNVSKYRTMMTTLGMPTGGDLQNAKLA